MIIIIYMVVIGGNDGFFDGNLASILDYDVSGDSYTQIGNMTEARYQHAISVVQYGDFSEWCD